MSANHPHPDQNWINETVAVLEAWLEFPTNSPTSQITGGGAIAVAESIFAGHHEARPCFMVPSATYGMRAALKALGVTAGSEVLIPGTDWPSTFAAVQSLGANAIPVPVEHTTLTIDPTEIARHRTRSTRAVVAGHLHGVIAGVPAIREALGDDLPIIEDAAQSLGSTLDGRPAGILGDAAVFSFGPEKAIDVGEAGMVVARDESVREAILHEIGHPARQLLGGVGFLKLGNFSVRPNPLGAVLLAQRLRTWDPDSRRFDHANLSDELDALVGVAVIGRGLRRANGAETVPVRVETGRMNGLGGYRISTSGARDIVALASGVMTTLNSFLVSRRPHHGSDAAIAATKEKRP